MIYKLKKEFLQEYIDDLIKNYEVWGPKKIGNDVIFS
jgi:hypothetical protein